MDVRKPVLRKCDALGLRLSHISLSYLIFLFCCVGGLKRTPFRVSIDAKKLIFSKHFYALWFRIKAHTVVKFQFLLRYVGALRHQENNIMKMLSLLV